jgi:hypothetical protein
MSKAVSTYNDATPGDVQSTGASCKSALDDLSGTAMPSPRSAPRKQRALARALQSAYLEAVHGFKDCAAAGDRNDYALMARAAQEIVAANMALQRARQLEP